MIIKLKDINPRALDVQTKQLGWQSGDMVEVVVKLIGNQRVIVIKNVEGK